MDPRTGLGRWRNFTISNYQLMEKLMDACRYMNTEEILNLSDVKERIEVYFEQTSKFEEMVAAHTRVEKEISLEFWKLRKEIVTLVSFPRCSAR